MKKIFPESNQILTRERGSVIIFVAVLMLVLLGFAAFAIDFGYVYGIKNKLQNAADSAALAGASVLFSNNQLCNSNGSPYSCCTGLNTGSCDPGVVDVNNVTQTAQALADLNNSGGSATTVTVEIGHYAFASIWDSPGTFSPSSNIQMSGWEKMRFSVLNARTDFINAVKVTVTREDVPRFFSRIWSSSDLSSTVQAIAYIGFAGYLAPGEVDEPIAICEDSITENGAFICNVGTMLNDNTQTARWTDFDQINCVTASTNNTRPLICNGNPDPIMFGKGVSTTNGTVGNEMTDIYNCWKDTGQFDSDDDGVPDTNLDTDSDGKPDRPWQLKLPVIDCSGNNNCRTVVGSVVVNVVWINDKNEDLDKKDPWIPSSMVNPNTGDVWSYDEAFSATENWNKFQIAFNLQNNNLTGPAEWEKKALYFLPDCSPQIPSGGTGGQNFGIMARYPKLVK